MMRPARQRQDCNSHHRGYAQCFYLPSLNNSSSVDLDPRRSTNSIFFDSVKRTSSSPPLSSVAPLQPVAQVPRLNVDALTLSGTSCLHALMTRRGVYSLWRMKEVSSELKRLKWKGKLNHWSWRASVISQKGRFCHEMLGRLAPPDLTRSGRKKFMFCHLCTSRMSALRQNFWLYFQLELLQE